MKVSNLNIGCLILIWTLFTGCGNIFKPSDELEQVTDYLSFNEIEGTYLFQPNDFEAKRLGIQEGDSVILEIFGGVIKKTRSSTYMGGKYSINKMILVLNKNSNKPYQDEWLFSNKRDELVEGQFINVISFHQKIMDGKNISYGLKKSASSDTLHIVGNTSDPEFEAIQIIDFRKIK